MGTIKSEGLAALVGGIAGFLAGVALDSLMARLHLPLVLRTIVVLVIGAGALAVGFSFDQARPEMWLVSGAGMGGIALGIFMARNPRWTSWGQPSETKKRP